MSSMDPMRDVFLIRSEILQKISLRPSHFKQLADTKSSSSMRQITQQTTYNSYLGRLQRSFLATADSSSPAISKTKLSNHSTPDAPVLTFQPIPKVNPNSQQQFFKRIQEILDNDTESVEYDNKVLVELINKHFPIGDVF